MPTSFGLSYLSWGDIKNFIDLSGEHLLPWECEALIDLSKIYAATYNASTKADAPKPYLNTDGEAASKRRSRVASIISRW